MSGVRVFSFDRASEISSNEEGRSFALNGSIAPRSFALTGEGK